MKIACLNKISPVGMNEFSKKYEVIDEASKAQLIMVRSANMFEFQPSKHLLAVARAGAGVNNIPLTEYAEKGIVVFNTPGANANAVKEMVIAGLLLASRDIIGGVEYIKENKQDVDIKPKIEKVKSNFAGNEIHGKKIGVIGLGAVGAKVANACVALGMQVLGFDPWLTEESKKIIHSKVEVKVTLDEIYPEVDFLTIHIPLLESTRNFIDHDVFSKMKPGCVLLNFSRDALVNDDELELAMNQGTIRKYVTDFPNPRVLQLEHVIAFPHLGASTEESEENCAYMAAHELMKYVETGAIQNSVNFPNIELEKRESKTRIIVLHHEEDLMNDFMNLLFNKPVMNITSKTNQHFGVTVLDIDEEISLDLLHKFHEIKGVIRVRSIVS